MRARIAAHISWAGNTDPAVRTAPARQAALERFERQVDPDGTLSTEERARRVEHARKAYFMQLALKSSRARQQKTGRDEINGPSDDPSGLNGPPFDDPRTGRPR